MQGYLKTTTMGLSEPVTTIRPFHIMRAEPMIIIKLIVCCRSWDDHDENAAINPKMGTDDAPDASSCW